MKKIIVLSLFAILSMTAGAQKFALIDMEYILAHVPAYEQGNGQINQMSKKWQTQIEALNAQASNLYKDYQNTAATLSPDQKRKKQEAVMKKEKEAADLKRRYFGPEGELEKLRTALITPIQEAIYKAVKTVSDRREYSLVIDRASNVNGIIYGSPKIDISDEVLQQLGLSN